ncbi:DUF1613-domain-containing protein [Lepidopterella palustris CBS 459.81]|uniref:tRNA (uracil-O(2)-)-methyltransferase n=1 Tax=Lepidopterella palustris CBS 459.81 TaxID=1314670 RepID=A0A8E2JDP4_9PEZI|nr:DUF1613-domain-containing protein [Lepidopterella palustris CBS 459.81]
MPSPVRNPTSDTESLGKDSGALDQPQPNLLENTARQFGKIGPQSTVPATPSIEGRHFQPRDLIKQPSSNVSGLPPELWTPMFESPAVFPPNYFLSVSQNLLRNPNILSSHLFRAEIYYDSQNDASFDPTARLAQNLSDFIPHMKAEYHPFLIPDGFPDYQLTWTVVRKLIPRNPQLDKPLIQTCHLFTSANRPPLHQKDDASLGKERVVENIDRVERNLIIYLPHAATSGSIPWYHPPVIGTATLYTWSNDPLSSPPGTLSFFYRLFPGTEVDDRMQRTALNMLRIFHKHATGLQEGYTKRVHHDIVITQKKFQDTYTYLKSKYAKILIQNWVEQTLATKHVFEDLGIAAFLIELWTEMYGDPAGLKKRVDRKGSVQFETRYEHAIKADAQRKFPGFVDIGCGNGVLVYVLLKEGWSGWGFDARRRKTWDTFPSDIREKLKEFLLVPQVFQSGIPRSEISTRSPTPFRLATADSSEAPVLPNATTSEFGSEYETIDTPVTPPNTNHSSNTSSMALPQFPSHTPSSLKLAPDSPPPSITDTATESSKSSAAPTTPGQVVSNAITASSSGHRFSTAADNSNPTKIPVSLTSSASGASENPTLSQNYTSAYQVSDDGGMRSIDERDETPQIRTSHDDPPFHNGMFPASTFIISNHSDELTAWTPLLAFLSESPFIAIPCCSHNFAGARFRAPSAPVKIPKPPVRRSSGRREPPGSLSTPSSLDREPLERDQSDGTAESIGEKNRKQDKVDDLNLAILKSASPRNIVNMVTNGIKRKDHNEAPETESKPDGDNPKPSREKCNNPKCKCRQNNMASKLVKPPKPPSAYAALCAWVEALTAEVGYEVEKEMLRIPSTRNAAIIGRKWAMKVDNLEERERIVRDILNRETGVRVDVMAREWVEAARKLWEKGGRKEFDHD